MVTGSGDTYDVAVSGMSSDGTVTAQVNANAAQDATNNGNTASGTASVTYDKTAPTETISQAATQVDPTSTAPIKFTVVFSEPIDQTTFSKADVDLSSSTAGGTLVGNVYDSGDHTTFEVRVNGMTTNGDVIAKINGGGINDAAGNANAPSTNLDNKVTWQQSAGNTTPTVVVDSPPFGSVYAKGTASITLKAHFTDPDNGPWTYTINWDDGTANSTGPLGTSGQNFQATHSFPNTGVYTMSVCVKDALGASGCAQDWIVVYDPNGGFVTGGGWLNVGAGSYVANPSLSGRANFGFNSQYKKNANVPTGETEFNFQVGNMNFHSTVYQWLVVSGFKAQYKGIGTINGAGSYSFTLTAYDGDLAAGNIPGDEFRIQITDDNNHNAVVFDNKMGALTDIDSASPQLIAGGSIVIHKA
jgi:hypothetical protein